MIQFRETVTSFWLARHKRTQLFLRYIPYSPNEICHVSDPDIAKQFPSASHMKSSLTHIWDEYEAVEIVKSVQYKVDSVVEFFDKNLG
jgi:hypothetical protein